MFQWPAATQALLTKLKIQLPIIQAPMGGAATSPLVAAVSNAGGLGSLAAGYLFPEKIHAEIKKIRQLTNKSFAVNLFIPTAFQKDEQKIQRSNQILNHHRRQLNLSEQTNSSLIFPNFAEQIAVIIEEKVPIFSFTFGYPNADIFQKLKANNIITIGTATTVREGALLAEKGCNIVVGQGSEAGGHRGTFLGTMSTSQIGTVALIPSLVDQIKIPVVAAGGIMDGRGIAAALALGASAVQMGTAFLTCSECEINPAHKQKILMSTEEDSVITKTFSGRPARAINNRFIEEMQKNLEIIPDYPIQNNLTQDIRQQAAKLNNSDFMSMWAGQATRLSREKSAKILINELEKETKKVLASFDTRD